MKKGLKEKSARGSRGRKGQSFTGRVNVPAPCARPFRSRSPVFILLLVELARIHFFSAVVTLSKSRRASAKCRILAELRAEFCTKLLGVVVGKKSECAVPCFNRERVCLDGNVSAEPQREAQPYCLCIAECVHSSQLRSHFKILTSSDCLSRTANEIQISSSRERYAILLDTLSLIMRTTVARKHLSPST